MERNQLPHPGSTSRRRPILKTRKVLTNPPSMPLLLRPTHHILLLRQAECPLVFSRHSISSRQLNSSNSSNSSPWVLLSQPNIYRIVSPEMIPQLQRFLQLVIMAQKQVHGPTCPHRHSRINRLRYTPLREPLLPQHTINPRRLHLCLKPK